MPSTSILAETIAITDYIWYYTSMTNPANHERNPFDDIIHEASAQLEGVQPGMPEFITELNHNRLGRAVAMQEMGQQGTTPKLIGYSLPLNREETSHLLIFENGHMYGLQAGHPDDTPLYQLAFASNDEPYTLNETRLSSAERRILNETTYHDRRNRISNLDPKGAEVMAGLVDQALDVARTLKEEREAAVQKTAKNLMEKFGPLLGLSRPEEPEQE